MKHLFYIFAIAYLLITSCCKPPDTEMKSTTLPNRYIGLDSIYSRMAAGDSVVIVCFGNSITAGSATTYPAVWQGLLRQQYSNNNITVINEGHGGWTAEMAADGFDTLILRHQPDLVTVIYGINDFYQGKTLDNYVEHLTEIIVKLKLANVATLVMSPTPLNNEYNNILIDYCTKASNVADTNQVAFFNMHQAMVGRIYAETDDPETLMPDEVHYTNTGYHIIAEELMKYWMAK